jgi:hypothetical protein
MPSNFIEVPHRQKNSRTCSPSNSAITAHLYLAVHSDPHRLGDVSQQDQLRRLTLPGQKSVKYQFRGFLTEARVYVRG